MRMTFGLTNALASFQNLVNDIFEDSLDIFVVVYLDYIMVFSSSEEEHVKHLAFVLQRLRDNNLFTKASNSANPQLASAKEHQSSSILPWLCQLVLFFHQKLLQKITSFTSLLKQDSRFIFDEEGLSQFQILKESFTTSPILSHFNPSLPTIVETDASDCVLAELNYKIHDKELLGIVWAFNDWRAFLLSLSNPFEVLTDHSSLQNFMSSKFLTRHQACWAEFISEFHFSITYSPGRLATLPDALSRRDNMYPERGVDFISKSPQSLHQVIKQDGIQESRFSSIKAEIFPYLVDKIQKEVWKDKDYKEILKKLARGESVTDYSLEPQSKLLLFKDTVVIPSNGEIQLNMLQKHHESPLVSYTRQEKTLKLIKRDFYWAGMNQFIKDYVSSCQKCSRNKNIHHKKLGLLKPLQIPSEPVKQSRIPNHNQLPPPPVLVEAQEEWEVAQVLGSKLKRGKLWYLVHWKRLTENPERTSLEPASNLTNSPDLVKDFHLLYPEQPGPITSRV
ncbi:hypothetical protein O181_058089 [Austropuccinia psidii MF-1]|uniref:Chromo domain-containing protein n=1 Tax=Austropuccinia psidii MF-1 TaxID=1389203 RepID=A0A9Q3EBS0_9BASI|nr:hypothetical protein [Austropuccinia psidii MF-1]